MVQELHQLPDVACGAIGRLAGELRGELDCMAQIPRRFCEEVRVVGLAGVVRRICSRSARTEELATPGTVRSSRRLAFGRTGGTSASWRSPPRSVP
jgi:hypothetical protein